MRGTPAQGAGGVGAWPRRAGRPYAVSVAHPLMFEQNDPLLARLRELALGLPGAAEKVSHGHPAFYTTKVFAYFGGAGKIDGKHEQHEHSVVVKPDEPERLALLSDPRSYRPAYLGPSGWVGLDLDDDTDWDEVAELVELSYRQSAGRRLIAELDSISPPNAAAPPAAAPCDPPRPPPRPAAR